VLQEKCFDSKKKLNSDESHSSQAPDTLKIYNILQKNIKAINFENTPLLQNLLPEG
jgi:hypothetical protein